MIKFVIDNPWVLIPVFIFSIVLGFIADDKFQDKKKLYRFLTVICITGMISSVGLGVSIWLANERPVSNDGWVEIYQNDLGAKVELTFQEDGDIFLDEEDKELSILAGKNDKNIKNLSDKATDEKIIRDIKLAVIKGDKSIQKSVILDKHNIVQKYYDLNNVKISKIEYRKIDGFARVFLGVYGSTNSVDEVGEIRITLESGEDAELKKVFEK
jgi:hypothetical protein